MTERETSDSAVRASVEAIWRIESAKLLGGLVRLVRDIDTAEDLAHEALVSALETWPHAGIPERPGAWLMTTAKHRALDVVRRRAMIERHHASIAVLEARSGNSLEAMFEEAVADDVLRLMLIACHPVLSRDARIALTLRLVGGLETREIARAFRETESTVAQRIVRAKRTIAEARVPFEVPEGEELERRVESVIEVLYVVFNEGYAATEGDEWVRTELCDEALRLARILCALTPNDSEAQGLLALLELQASRLRARRGPKGEAITLLEQERSKWDRVLVSRGLAALARADSLRAPRGPYTLMAAIAACHARAKSVGETDWNEIVALYDALFEMTASPIVALNRAVAVGMASGPLAALELIDALSEEPVLDGYPYLPSARGDFLEKLGRYDEARIEFERAAAWTRNRRERELLTARAAACSTINSRCGQGDRSDRSS